MTSSNKEKYITWCNDRTSGLNWVVFQPDGSSPQGSVPEDGIVPTGEELGEYATYVEARKAHPDARITPEAAEAIKYGNL
jgi:hypothetical protein